MPHCHTWDEAKAIPVRELLQKAAATGWLPAIVGKPWPVEYCGACPFGQDFDYFHEVGLPAYTCTTPPATPSSPGNKPHTSSSADAVLVLQLVLHDELARCGSGGVLWGLSGGLSIGLPPVLKFASKALKVRVAPSPARTHAVRVSGVALRQLVVSQNRAVSRSTQLSVLACRFPERPEERWGCQTDLVSDVRRRISVSYSDSFATNRAK